MTMPTQIKQEELTFLPKEKNGEFIRRLTTTKQILTTVISLVKTRSWNTVSLASHC